MNEEIKDEKDDDDEYLIANAIQIKVFSSDLFGFVDDDKSQLSKMFTNTFVLAMHTTIEHIKLAACRFWCLDDTEYDVWYRCSSKKPYGVVKIEQEYYRWTA